MNKKPPNSGGFSGYEKRKEKTLIAAFDQFILQYRSIMKSS